MQAVASLAGRFQSTIGSLRGPWAVALFVEAPLICLAFQLWLAFRVEHGFRDFAAFRGAADALIAGSSPYPAVDPAVLLQQGSLAADNFLYPPLTAALFAPFAVLPWHVAVVLFEVAIIGAIPLALYLLGVRDWRCYGAAFICPCTTALLGVGALASLFALGLAAAWRHRDRAWITVPLLVLVIFSKLFLWPLAIWLLATRRWRTAVAVAVGGVAVNLAAWAAIDFAGLRQYPELLSTFTDVFERTAYSTTAFGLALGATPEVARWAVVVLAIGACVAIVRLARRDDGDRLAFSAAIGTALLVSPIVWMHYFVLLFVPIALARPRLSALWLAPVLLWSTPLLASDGELWRVAVALAVVALTLAYSLRVAYDRLGSQLHPAAGARAS